jgi:protein-export membrane protein SecD
MASRSPRFWPVVSIIAAALILIVALPDSVKGGWAPSFLKPGFHLGLDLAGGTQLDFRISESEMQQQLTEIDTELAQISAAGGNSERASILQAEKAAIQEQQKNLVEAIRTVLERRINSLGVSEATITPSYIGGEKHLLVECPGVIDVQECINTVGKTIQLEFKEEFTEATAEYTASVRAKVDAAQRRITQSGTTLAVLGEDLGTDLGVGYQPPHWFFRDQLPQGLDRLWNATPQSGITRLNGAIITPVQTEDGGTENRTMSGIFLSQVITARTMTGRVIQEAPVAFGELAKEGTGVSSAYEKDVVLDTPLSARLIGLLRGMKAGELKTVTMEDNSAKVVFMRLLTPGREQVDVSHILVAYKGANAAPATVTRTKEEALAKAQQLKKQLDAGAVFEDLARAESDGTSKANGGKLEGIGHGELVPSFEDVAFAQPVGNISNPVETPFGYHLIRVDKAPYQTPDKASFDSLTYTGPDAADRANDALKRLQNGQVTRQEEAVQLQSIFFSLVPTGWKDTSLDGKHFRSASVNLDPTTNLPLVQILFDDEGAKMFQELTKKNIGKRIAIFVGGELVSAPTVQGEIIGGTAVITGSQNITEAQQLAQDLNTGAIPAPIYLSGQRTVEPTLGASAVSTSLLAGIVGIIVVMLYMLLVYRMLGLFADIALTVYAIIFAAMFKLPLLLVTDQYIVLTLAGIAGTLLSIGMAVDTNVLVFERMKEELRKGKSLKTAVEIGFDKAWPSIRDSNVSTVITCLLLFLIGTSIVRGFAVTLGLGVVVSMFTGMIVSRWLLRRLAMTSVAEKAGLFPGMQKRSGDQN